MPNPTTQAPCAHEHLTESPTTVRCDDCGVVLRDKMTQATPGPWRAYITEEGAYPSARIESADGSTVAEIPAFVNGDKPRNAVRDAHLIAAAPTLRDSCEALLVGDTQLAIDLARKALR